MLRHCSLIHRLLGNQLTRRVAFTRTRTLLGASAKRRVLGALFASLKVFESASRLFIDSLLSASLSDQGFRVGVGVRECCYAADVSVMQSVFPVKDRETGQQSEGRGCERHPPPIYSARTRE